MGVLIVHVSQMCTCAHHSVWGLIVFTFIYYNSFPTSPLSVTKETTAVEKCVRQPLSWHEAPHISTVISLLIHLIVDVKKCVRHFFVRTHPLYMRPQGHSNHLMLLLQLTWDRKNDASKKSFPNINTKKICTLLNIISIQPITTIIQTNLNLLD